MISALYGTLVSIDGTCGLVVCYGVGYEVLFVGAAARTMIVGNQNKWAIHTHIREDGWSLYGFKTTDERNLFRRLLSVSGVGPKVAVALLNNFGVGDLRQAIQTEDVKAISKIPGLGPKTARKLVLALKTKEK